MTTEIEFQQKYGKDNGSLIWLVYSGASSEVIQDKIVSIKWRIDECDE